MKQSTPKGSQGKIKIPKKYCYSCGKELIATLTSTTYDTDTGKPNHYWKYSCSNNWLKHWWQKHEIDYPSIDYF